MMSLAQYLRNLSLEDNRQKNVTTGLTETKPSSTGNAGHGSGRHRDAPPLPTYSMAEVAEHWDPSECWLVLDDKVYDVTPFFKLHPGGEDIILENAGRDCTVPFSEVRHSRDAIEMLQKYLIGDLVENERLKK